MFDEKKNDTCDFRLTSSSSTVENRSFLFWGFNRANIKRTSLYKEFLANDRNLTFDMSDYSLQVKNELLTQTHKDVLEALLTFNTSFSTQDIAVSSSSVMSFLGKNSKNTSWLFDILEELNNVNIRYFKKNTSSDIIFADGFKILSSLSYDSDDNIVFSFHDSFLSLYEKGKLLSYCKYTPFISNLDHDISKQVVRWLLTYDYLQINISNLLSNKLGLKNVVKKRSLYNYIALIKEEDLSMFGIWVEGDNICIDRSKVVNFFDGKDIGKFKGSEKVKIKQSTLPFFDLS